MNTIFYSFTIGVLFITLFILFFYFCRKIKKSQIQQIFCVDLLLMGLTCFFVLLQMVVPQIVDIDPVYFSYFYYIGLAFYPIALYFTTLIFTDTKIQIKPSYLFWLVVPIVCLIGLWTNSKTGFFFRNYDVQINNCEFGVFYIILEIYSNILYLISLYKLLKYFTKNSGLYTGQLNLFLVGIVFPFLLNILGVLGIIEMTVYVTPIALSLSLICFTLALFRFQLLDTVPIALTKITDALSDGYIVLNDKNIIINHNFPFLQIFEIENMEIDSMHLFDLLKNPNLSDLDESDLIYAIQAVNQSNETLSLYVHFQKINKYLKLEINNIKSNNSIVGTLILVKDNTKQHEEMELTKSNQNMLIEKERLSSIGELIGGVAHNLKTPIFSITGATEGLKDLIKEYKSSLEDETVSTDDHLAIASDMEEWTSKIEQYTSYMSDVVQAISDQATTFINDNSYETFTVDDLMKNVNILMKTELQQALITLNISYKLTRELKLQGDMNSLVQILDNIITNAIESYQGKPNKPIDIEISNTENDLIIQIKDYGVGISDEVKNKLFKEIVTTKGDKGTGIGLFISYSNLKAQFGGDIKFESEEGVGSTFKVIIPLNM